MPLDAGVFGLPGFIVGGIIGALRTRGSGVTPLEDPTRYGRRMGGTRTGPVAAAPPPAPVVDPLEPDPVFDTPAPPQYPDIVPPPDEFVGPPVLPPGPYPPPPPGADPEQFIDEQDYFDDNMAPVSPERIEDAGHQPRPGPTYDELPTCPNPFFTTFAPVACRQLPRGSRLPRARLDRRSQPRAVGRSAPPAALGFSIAPTPVARSTQPRTRPRDVPPGTGAGSTLGRPRRFPIEDFYRVIIRVPERRRQIDRVLREQRRRMRRQQELERRIRRFPTPQPPGDPIVMEPAPPVQPLPPRPIFDPAPAFPTQPDFPPPQIEVPAPEPFISPQPAVAVPPMAVPTPTPVSTPTTSPARRTRRGTKRRRLIRIAWPSVALPILRRLRDRRAVPGGSTTSSPPEFFPEPPPSPSPSTPTVPLPLPTIPFPSIDTPPLTSLSLAGVGSRQAQRRCPPCKKRKKNPRRLSKTIATVRGFKRRMSVYSLRNLR